MPGNADGNPELAICVSITADGTGAYGFATPEEAEELARELIAAAAEWRALMAAPAPEATS